ncbi:MAG: PepSY-associated TM helix domain-containing protein, partial [Pseudomonadota bacterium]
VQVAEDARPAPLADLDKVLADSSARAGSPPGSIQIAHWGRADANLIVHHGPTGASLNGTNFTYNGVSGEFTGVKPTVGATPSFGDSLLGLMGPLHFGHFGGLLSKIVWFSLGLAMAYVTLTGLQLWTQRRLEDPNWRFMTRAIVTVGYGTAVAMAGSAAAFFVSLPFEAAMVWTPVGFVLTSLACIVAGVMIRDVRRLSTVLLQMLAVGLLILPVLRMAVGGTGWPGLFAMGDATVIGMDLSMALAGAVLLAGSFGLIERWRRPSSAKTFATPAE